MNTLSAAQRLYIIDHTFLSTAFIVKLPALTNAAWPCHYIKPDQLTLLGMLNFWVSLPQNDLNFYANCHGLWVTYHGQPISGFTSLNSYPYWLFSFISTLKQEHLQVEKFDNPGAYLLEYGLTILHKIHIIYLLSEKWVVTMHGWEIEAWDGVWQVNFSGKNSENQRLWCPFMHLDHQKLWCYPLQSMHSIPKQNYSYFIRIREFTSTTWEALSISFEILPDKGSAYVNSFCCTIY